MGELLDAIENFDKERLRRLPESGADPNIRGEGGITPLHLAVDIEAEDAIYRYDTSRDVIPPDGTFVRLLLVHGADVEARDDTGETPLDWARQKNHVAAIGMLTRWSAV